MQDFAAKVTLFDRNQPVSLHPSVSVSDTAVSCSMPLPTTSFPVLNLTKQVYFEPFAALWQLDFGHWPLAQKALKISILCSYRRMNGGGGKGFSEGKF